MKKAITVIFLFVSILSFGQAKKDSLPPAPVEPSHTLTLTDRQWNQIFSMIRQNGKMTGLEIENTIEFLTKNLQAVEPPKKK